MENRPYPNQHANIPKIGFFPWSHNLGSWTIGNNMNKGYRLHYVKLPAREIFGMVGRCGGGYNTIWTDWSDEGRYKRKLIMREFEQGLDKITGHYRKLEESILQEGLRNPVIITCGLPRRRTMECLPPEMRGLPPDQLLLLESTMGGSRLHVCQKHHMDIACLVNDWTGRFAAYPEITSLKEAEAYFIDQPKLSFDPALGLVEAFDQQKVGYHLGEEWSEDRVMPLRAPMWIRIMNKHGYQVENLPKIVLAVLENAGVNQDQLD